MFNQIKLVAFLAIGGFVAWSVFMDGSGSRGADLGQVLDRTEFTLDLYNKELEGRGATEVTAEDMEEFRVIYTAILNSEPRFYDKTLGLTLREDASFAGFEDTNADGIRDAGEDQVFTVEIDEENSRLIASDVSGNSTGLRFSGTGLLAGVLIGNLISRQRSAGITRSSFSNRSVTPRASYQAPSARSGGPRAGK